MLELYEFFIDNRHKPLGYILLAAFVLIADRLGRKLITHQVKRLFHIDDKSEFKEYIHNQHLIMERLGIPYDTKPIAESPRRSIAMSLKISLKSLWELTKRRIKKMSNINKGILLPLLSAIALFVKEAFGYEIEAEYIDMAANIILYLFMLIGIFMNFKKKEAPKTEDKEAYYH